MQPARLLVVLRLCLLAAVFASAALVIDYANAGDPAFCGAESNCFKVRTSDVGRVIAETLHPLTLPQIALLLFVFVLGQSFFVRSRSALVGLAGTTVAGALAAVAFIAIQAKMGLFCVYCMVVDVSMIFAAGAAVLLARALPTIREVDRELGASMATPVTLGWGAAGFAVTVLPFVWSRYPEIPPTPPALAALATPGKLTVVSFTDFECPYCRQLAEPLGRIKADPNVHFVRKMVPLDGHPGAQPAALAYLCTPEAQREDMAQALYRAAKLDYQTVVEIAGQAKVDDLLALRKCMASPETKTALEADKRFFYEELGGRGLPTTYVGPTLVKGYAPDRLATAYARAGGGLSLPFALLPVLAAAAALAAAFRNLRVLADEPAQRASAPSEPPAEPEAAPPAPAGKKAKKKKKPEPAAQAEAPAEGDGDA